MTILPMGYYDCSSHRYSPEIEREIHRRVEDEKMLMQQQYYAMQYTQQWGCDPAKAETKKPRNQNSNLLLLT